MVLTEEQKKERKKIVNRRYRENLKKRAEAGDAKAIKQLHKNSKSNAYQAAKSYIKYKANKKDISEFRDLLAQRVKELNENKKAKK